MAVDLNPSKIASWFSQLLQNNANELMVVHIKFVCKNKLRCKIFCQNQKRYYAHITEKQSQKQNK